MVNNNVKKETSDLIYNFKELNKYINTCGATYLLILISVIGQYHQIIPADQYIYQALVKIE